MSAQRIVIANSIGIDSQGLAIIHSPSRWTNSSTDKDVFTYYPWELAYASTLLKRETSHTVKLIDGCLEKLDAASLAEKIIAENPTYLLMEPATRTWEDDKRVMQMVKDACRAQLIVAGPHACAFPDEVAQIADYVLIGEYEYTVLDIVNGCPREEILGVYPNARRPLLDVNALPWPEDEDVSRLSYGIPGEPASEYVEVQTYATRGCPMSCNFCVARHLYYDKPNWRPRTVADIIAELKYLRKKYPAMEGVFFDEECHNANKKFILELSQALIDNELHDLKIDAMCTYFTLDEEMMDAMRRAGYYLLRVGIETAGEGAARGINLGAKFDIEKLKNTLRYAKKIGLKMYGTFTFGSPGATQADDQKTLDFMDEVIGEGLLWRFQTSICTPQPGTPFYAWAKKEGFLKTFATNEYDGGNTVVLEYPDYSSEEIMAMYMKSQRFFDVALGHRFTEQSSESEKALRTFSYKKILVLRTTRMPQMTAALRTVRAAFPDAEIDVLGQSAVRDELQQLQKEGLVSAIHMYEAGFFMPDGLTDELRATLAAANYECGFIVYNNLKGRGYEKAEACFDACKIPTWKAFNSEGALIC